MTQDISNRDDLMSEDGVVESDSVSREISRSASQTYSIEVQSNRDHLCRTMILSDSSRTCNQ